MRKAFLDTNIVLDLLLRRQPFYGDAMKLFSLADLGVIQLQVSSLTILNAHYILTKIIGNDAAKTEVRRFSILVLQLPLNDKIIELALNDSKFGDFEDGVQYYTAIESKADVIITRDLKDFGSSKIPVMTAQDFLNI